MASDRPHSSLCISEPDPAGPSPPSSPDRNPRTQSPRRCPKLCAFLLVFRDSGPPTNVTLSRSWATDTPTWLQERRSPCRHICEYHPPLPPVPIDRSPARSARGAARHSKSVDPNTVPRRRSNQGTTYYINKRMPGQAVSSTTQLLTSAYYSSQSASQISAADRVRRLLPPAQPCPCQRNHASGSSRTLCARVHGGR